MPFEGEKFEEIPTPPTEEEKEEVEEKVEEEVEEKPEAPIEKEEIKPEEKPPEIEEKLEEVELEKEIEKSPEEKLALEVIEHPLIQRGVERYKIFSKYYFEGVEESKKRELEREGIEVPTPEKIKQGADKILEKDSIYQNISELIESGQLNRPLENKDFIKYAIDELGEEGLDRLKRAKEEGYFDEALREILISREIEREKRKGAEKGIIVERAGKMWVEIIDEKICRPHLPRIAEDLEKTIQGMEESYRVLCDLLESDERFKDVKRLEGISWLFGQKRIAEALNKKFGWKPYKKEELEKLPKEVYEEIQNTGIMVSSRLFEEHLLKGKKPEIGGRWITKKEFLKKMRSVK